MISLASADFCLLSGGVVSSQICFVLITFLSVTLGQFSNLARRTECSVLCCWSDTVFPVRCKCDELFCFLTCNTEIGWWLLSPYLCSPFASIYWPTIARYRGLVHVHFCCCYLLTKGLKFMSNLLPVFLVTEYRITFIDENKFLLHISLTNLCAFPLLAICGPGFSTELEQDCGLTSTSDVNGWISCICWHWVVLWLKPVYLMLVGLKEMLLICYSINVLVYLLTSRLHHSA